MAKLAEKTKESVAVNTMQPPPSVEPAKEMQHYQPDEGVITTTLAGSGGLLPSFGPSNQEYWCNFPSNDPGTPMRVMACLQNNGVKADAVINSTVFVTHAFCHTVELVSQQSGEVTILPRTVLVDAAGNRYQFVSVGIYDSLQWIVRMWGKGPWLAPPMPMTIRGQQTRIGNKMLFIEVPADKPLPRPVRP